jgi:hypothetical protein
MNLLFKLLKSGLLLAIKEILDQLLAVHVEDIFVFLVLFKQVKGPNDVVIEHLLQLLVGLDYPGEIFGDCEVRLLLLLQEGHQVIL